VIRGISALASCAVLAPDRRARALQLAPKTLSQQILYSTTRIVATEGKYNSSGTGFFFAPPTSETQVVPLLVTNQHVVRGTTGVTLSLHTKDNDSSMPGSSRSFTINAALGSGWIPHPSADLCALPIRLLLGDEYEQLFLRPIGLDLVASNRQLADFDAVEDVLMVGYPVSFWDEVNNLPVVRKGITASDPAVDFDGKPETILDISVYPGSSGSPVFVFDKGGYVDKDGFHPKGLRSFLIGIISEWQYVTPRGTVILQEAQTTLKGQFQVQLGINIARMIKARELLGLRDTVFSQLGLPTYDGPIYSSVSF